MKAFASRGVFIFPAVDKKFSVARLFLCRCGRVFSQPFRDPFVSQTLDAFPEGIQSSVFHGGGQRVRRRQILFEAFFNFWALPQNRWVESCKECLGGRRGETLVRARQNGAAPVRIAVTLASSAGAGQCDGDAKGAQQPPCLGNAS